jgi:1-acyl-sn-glycerol-3-phosphate acyltransferase
LYYFEKGLIRLIMLLFVRFEIEGRENIPLKGPLLVVANHLSVADPPIIGVNLKRQLKFMAKEELFGNWFLSFFVRQFGAFPVYRGRSSRDALRKAGSILQSGQALVMFPEGQRSKTGSMQPAQAGAALIAYHNNCTLLPAGISGTESIRGLRWILRRPRVKLKIGSPFKLADSGRSLSREQLAQYTEDIAKRIADQLPEKYRGKFR